MANYSSLLSLSVCFLVLFHGCFAQIEQVVNQGQSPRQQPRQRFQTQCRLRNLNAVQPRHRFRSEAGVTEFWDQNEEQFQCAGVAFLRHTIERKGLLLPSYNNAPQLIFVVRGQGIQGVVLPGCPETYQTQVQQGQGQQQSSRDQHQKLRQFKEGDVLALPAGVPHWIHNNGQSQLVLVSLIDVGNNNNQLDQFFRKFFLAGNPQQGIVTGGQRRNGEQSPRHRGQEEEQQEEEQRESGGNNVFSPLDENALADSLGIDTSLARKLKNNNDRRGAIVRMEHDFQLTSPQRAEREQRQQSEGEEEEEEESEQEEERGERRESRRGRGHEGRTTNGLEETFCTMRMKQRTDSSFPDIFNPRAGRITTVNSFNLPILQQLQLSAERGVLYRNAFYAPHWNVDAHSIVYITKGNGRVQIVSENGESVLDERVEEGQVFVVPQNFVVLKKAGERGLEWIAFKTNANANISPIAGRGSFLSGTPVEVLSKAFGISTEAAFRLKQGRQEQSLFGPRQQHQYY